MITVDAKLDDPNKLPVVVVEGCPILPKIPVDCVCCGCAPKTLLIEKL